jgi:hypothetical protein
MRHAHVHSVVVFTLKKKIKLIQRQMLIITVENQETNYEMPWCFDDEDKQNQNNSSETV